MAASSSAALPVVVIAVLLIVALAGTGIFILVRRRRRLAQQAARPYSFGSEGEEEQETGTGAGRQQRPSFINIMPVMTVLTAPISPSVASSFQTREPPPSTPPHRRGSLYSPRTPSASIRSNPFSDTYRNSDRPSTASTSMSDVASTLRGMMSLSRARSPSGSRAPSRSGSISTIRTTQSVTVPPRESRALPPVPVPAPVIGASEHPFSPDFRPALSNPVVLRVRTSVSVAPPPFSPMTATVTSSTTPGSSTAPVAFASAKKKEFEPTPEEREHDVTDPPPSYTPRSGLSAFAIPRSSAHGHARSPSVMTWDSGDEE